jgi:dTDP-4-dehydrorhamnose reductase
MKILITGAKGQLGHKIIEVMGSKHELILTDVDNMDITDLEVVRRVVTKEKPGHIIHAAAYTKVDKAEEEIELCRKINALGTKNVAIAAKENGAKLIYISTDFVFDGSKKTPYTEEDVANPLSVYGLTKYEGEKFVREICDEHYIIRVSWLFGELPKESTGESKGTNFVETMLRLAKNRSTLSVVSDQIGSPTYTGDLVETISKLIDVAPAFGTYHFSGSSGCSWYDFAKEIFAQTKTKIDLRPISNKEFPQKAKRPSYSYLGKRKIKGALRIEVRGWKEMLGEYLSEE